MSEYIGRNQKKRFAGVGIDKPTGVTVDRAAWMHGLPVYRYYRERTNVGLLHTSRL